MLLKICGKQVASYVIKNFEGGFIHGNCMTVTGKTMQENLKDIN